MTTKTRNWLIAIFILVFPFVFFGVFFINESLTLPPPPALPNPNGYDDLVKAGQMVSTNSWNYDAASLDQLRETTMANAPALALARAAFSNECRVPLQFSEAYNESHLSDLAAMKRLAQAFLTEGDLAKKEGRSNDAAKSFLDDVRLGNAVARGGVLIDQMVGTACEALGTDHLQTLTNLLDAKSCCETAATLETLDSQRQTWNEVMQQENDWSRRTFTGIRYEIMRLMNRKSIQKNIQKAGQKFQERQLKTRQLILELATRACELEKGHPPASAADLAPDYLKAVPQDPFTGADLSFSHR